jgi:hypothetical protein
MASVATSSLFFDVLLVLSSAYGAEHKRLWLTTRRNQAATASCEHKDEDFPAKIVSIGKDQNDGTIA